MIKHLVVVAAVAAAASGAARAERASDHAWLDVGGFIAKIDSNLRIDHETLGEGTDVDFERHLGLDDNRFLPKASAGVRIGKRFRVEADYFSLNREREIVLSESIRIEDTVFPLNAEVRTDFDTDIYRLAGGYSIIRDDKVEFGVSAGAHVTKASFRIEAQVLGVTLEEHRSKSVPLPNVGVFGNVHLFGPVSLQGNIDAFKVKAGGYKGTLIDSQIGLEARFARHFGVGLGYRHAHYKVVADKSDWHGKLTYDYFGPMAYLTLAL